LTISGELDEFLNRSLGATPDENGVYHIKQDHWQSRKYIGYNDFYDYVFDIVTDMSPAKFDFTYNEEQYIFWAWKGDYINLGAGAELGIYYGGEPHWLINTDLAMKMTMDLYLGDKKIASWAPDENNWWITSFVPEYQNVSAADITAIITVTFSDPHMLYAFSESEKVKKDSRWTFDWANYKATFTH